MDDLGLRPEKNWTPAILMAEVDENDMKIYENSHHFRRFSLSKFRVCCQWIGLGHLTGKPHLSWEDSMVSG